jgi:hypothetical protein
VNCFLENDFLETVSEKLNLFRAQHAGKYKKCTKSLAWKYAHINLTDIKKFLAIIIMMGHVKKDKIREYWSARKLLEKQIFGKLMSRSRFKQIWSFWHYSDNSALNDEADRLYKIMPVLDIRLEELRKHYKPP